MQYSVSTVLLVAVIVAAGNCTSELDSQFVTRHRSVLITEWRFTRVVVAAGGSDATVCSVH